MDLPDRIPYRQFDRAMRLMLGEHVDLTRIIAVDTDGDVLTVAHRTSSAKAAFTRIPIDHHHGSYTEGAAIIHTPPTAPTPHDAANQTRTEHTQQ